MLLNLMRFVGMGIASVALANVALAEGANVTADASSAKLGGEFSAGLEYTDNGMMKATGFTPPSESWFAVHAANVKLDGKINSKTDYSFEFNLLGNGTPLTHGYGTHWLMSNVGFSLGRMKVKQGGFDQLHNDYYRTAWGTLITPGSGHLAFDAHEDMLAFHVKAGGDLTIQFVNDVTKATAANPAGTGMYNKDKHPTFILNWQGDFGGIAPAIGLGSYDNNKSRWIDLGVGVDMTQHMKNSGVMASVDVYLGSRAAPYLDGTEMKDATDETTSYSLWAGYNMSGTGMPWFYYSSLDVKQSDKLHGKDLEYNGAGAWDDNGSVIALGMDLSLLGKGWTPYFALVTRSGAWEDPANAGKAETKSDMSIKLGAHGSI